MIKIFKWIALILVVVVVVGVPALVGVRPFIGPKARPLTDRRFEPTQARVDRGKYLATTAQAPRSATAGPTWLWNLARSRRNPPAMPPGIA